MFASLISGHTVTAGGSDGGPCLSTLSFSDGFSAPTRRLNLTKAMGAPVLAGSFSWKVFLSRSSGGGYKTLLSASNFFRSSTC
jgi:hypothetical protein|tara:strand:- start:876 stop:1124 length:249 start_codon:yes stop_codon:yes gene_type:complete